MARGTPCRVDATRDGFTPLPSLADEWMVETLAVAKRLGGEIRELGR